MKFSELGSRRVAIWGAGSEGLAAARAIRSWLPEKELVVLEESVKSELPEWLSADPLVEIKLGAVSADQLQEFDVVIKSPGISLYRDEIVTAKQAGVTFTSGTNLWFAENAGFPTICVTGSKGKSTTTNLICHLLNACGVPARMAGNIGVPLLDALVPDPEVSVYVVELSSYQLSDFTGTPTIALLLNLYPEHLDWHKGEAAYFRDKANLLARVTQARIVNREDRSSRRFVESLDKVVYFNAEETFHHDATTVYRQREPWLTSEDVQLLGEHNLSNICAALTTVSRYGVPLEKEAVRAALHKFKGLNHRLTRLGERDGRLYVNDSIATIPQATVAAIRAFPGRAISVLAGGYDRGLDQHGFAEMLWQERPFAVVTLPGTGARLCQELREIAAANPAHHPPQIHEASCLEEAVEIARRITPVGGVVLLSPGAPSYNTHRNFIERGNEFAKVAGLAFPTTS